MPRKSPHPSRFPVTVAVVILAAMVLGALLGFLNKFLVALSIMASATSAVLVALDKRRATNKKWRISERTLHAVELLGGWPGSLAAQHVVRHKNLKVSYQVVFVLCATAHATFLIWLAL